MTLNLTGGWNGDLYAYVQYGSGFTALLNRVGVAEAHDGPEQTTGPVRRDPVPSRWLHGEWE